MKLSRRHLLALAGVTAGQAVAQNPPATSAPAPVPSATNPDAVAKAREENRLSAEVLHNFAIPMSTEPAFTFRP